MHLRLLKKYSFHLLEVVVEYHSPKGYVLDRHFLDRPRTEVKLS
jgi:hypothetical protein